MVGCFWDTELNGILNSRGPNPMKSNEGFPFSSIQLERLERDIEREGN